MATRKTTKKSTKKAQKQKCIIAKIMTKEEVDVTDALLDKAIDDMRLVSLAMELLAAELEISPGQAHKRLVKALWDIGIGAFQDIITGEYVMNNGKL